MSALLPVHSSEFIVLQRFWVNQLANIARLRLEGYDCVVVHCVLDDLWPAVVDVSEVVEKLHEVNHGP